MCAVGLQPSVALQRASVVQYRRVRRETNRRMLSTLILILSVPDALQPRGPALSSLKPAELTTATPQPQPQLPLHPAFTAAPVLTEAAAPPSASTNATATAITTKRSKMKAKGEQPNHVRARSNATSKPRQRQGKAGATSQPKSKRERPSSNTTYNTPKQRQAKASTQRAARLARVHGSHGMAGMPVWLVGAFVLGLLVPVGLAVHQHQHRCRQSGSPK